jgi:hypothetical protein
VIWTSGGLNKLDVYRKLGVREVWFWKAGRLEVYVLRAERYVRTPRSRLVPEVDLDLLTSFLHLRASRGIRALGAAVRARRRRKV